MSRQAIGRQTDAGALLENFMDEKTDDLSTNVFDGLEAVAESIDDVVNKILGNLQDAQEDLNEFKAENTELKERIEELEDEIK